MDWNLTNPKSSASVLPIRILYSPGRGWCKTRAFHFARQSVTTLAVKLLIVEYCTFVEKLATHIKAATASIHRYNGVKGILWCKIIARSTKDIMQKLGAPDNAKRVHRQF